MINFQKKLFAVFKFKIGILHSDNNIVCNRGFQLIATNPEKSQIYLQNYPYIS